MKIYLSPSSQQYNKYGYGDTTEAEQCYKIATACWSALKKRGVNVKMPAKVAQDAELNVKYSNQYNADYHICIHTNAVGGNSKPIAEGAVIFVDPRNINMQMPYTILDALNTLKGKSSIYGVREHSALYEINCTTAKCVYIECEFHDNPKTAKWIIENTDEIGQAIAKGICAAIGVEWEVKNTMTEIDKAKEAAINSGIIKGYDNGDYGWTDNLTREQLAIILYRLGLIK